jgi:hypothetical protein
MGETTFKIWLRNIEPELILEEPRYSKTSKLLSPRAFKFLMLECFDDPTQINEMINKYFKELGVNRHESP